MAIAKARSGELVELLPKAFYSPTEVAELASLSSSTVLNYIHDGRLAAVRLSARTYRIPRKAVIRLLELEPSAPTITDVPAQTVDL